MQQIQSTPLSSVPQAEGVAAFVEKASLLDLSPEDQRRAAVAHAVYAQPVPDQFRFVDNVGAANEIAYELTLHQGNLSVYTPVQHTANTTTPIYAAFRGTLLDASGASIYDLYMDMSVLRDWGTNSQANLIMEDVAVYANALKAHLDIAGSTNVVELTGHSLGGLLSILVYDYFMQRGWHTQRIQTCTVFNPYILPIEAIKQIQELCSSPMGDFYNEYRTQIRIHSVTNDFASTITQTAGAFGTIYKYPAPSNIYVPTWAGQTVNTILLLPNHKMDNFVPAARRVIELINPLQTLNADTAVNIKTVDTFDFTMFGVQQSQPLYLVDSDSASQLPKLSHPEVQSTNYERFTWTYKGRATASTLPFQRFMLKGTNISYLTEWTGPTGSQVYFYVTQPGTHDEIAVAPIGDTYVLQQAMLGATNTNEGVLYNQSPDHMNFNDIPMDVLRTEELPSVADTSATWQIDTTVYSHQGHRRDLVQVGLTILNQGATSANVTITGADQAIIHAFSGFVWGGGNAMDSVSANETMIGIMPTYPHTLGNVEAPFPPSGSIDEGIWTLTRHDDVYSITNTETNRQQYFAVEVQSGYTAESGKAHVKMYIGSTANGDKAYIQSVPAASSHPDHGIFTVISTQAAETTATVWCIQAI